MFRVLAVACWTDPAHVPIYRNLITDRCTFGWISKTTLRPCSTSTNHHALSHNTYHLRIVSEPVWDHSIFATWDCSLWSHSNRGSQCFSAGVFHRSTLSGPSCKEPIRSMRPPKSSQGSNPRSIPGIWSCKASLHNTHCYCLSGWPRCCSTLAVGKCKEWNHSKHPPRRLPGCHRCNRSVAGRRMASTRNRRSSNCSGSGWAHLCSTTVSSDRTALSRSKHCRNSSPNWSVRSISASGNRTAQSRNTKQSPVS